MSSEDFYAMILQEIDKLLAEMPSEAPQITP